MASKTLSDYELKYSRQIGVLGLEANYKLANYEVFIYGVRGLGIEVCKHLILSGVKKIHIFDNKILSYEDLSTNPFINEINIGKLRRDFAALTKLKDINKDVSVEVAMFDPFKDMHQLKQFNIVIFTEFANLEFLYKVNEMLREVKRCFIYACASGLFGFVFTDFGKEFLIRDSCEYEYKAHAIKCISKGCPGVVTIDQEYNHNYNNNYQYYNFNICKDNNNNNNNNFNEYNKYNNNYNNNNITTNLSLKEGDYVSFAEVVGMTEVNETPPRPIKIINSKQFTIEDTTKYSDYICGGLVERVKVPKPIYYKSLRDCLQSVYINDDSINEIKNYNSDIYGRKEFLHSVFVSLNNIFSINNNYFPTVLSNNELEEYKDIIKKSYLAKKLDKLDWAERVEQFNEGLVMDILKTLNIHISPVCTLIGGIVGLETLKYTGKFIPINQLLYFDFYENNNNKNTTNNNLIYDTTNNCINKLNITSDNSENKVNTINNNKLYEINDNKTSKYSNILKLYGDTILDSIKDLNILIIGSGALGTEITKQLSLMGFCKGKGKFTIVDCKNIKPSDLGRQFIIKEEDISKPKVDNVASMIKSINNDITTQIFTIEIKEENEDIYNEAFWNQQDLVISCVNNNISRAYIDKQCILNKKTLVNLGMSGAKAHMQIIISNLTNCNSDLVDINSNIVKTISLNDDYFPYTFEKCINFSNSLFYRLFIEDIKDLKSLIKNTDYFLNDVLSQRYIYDNGYNYKENNKDILIAANNNSNSEFINNRPSVNSFNANLSNKYEYNYSITYKKEKISRLTYLLNILLAKSSLDNNKILDLTINFAYDLFNNYFTNRIKQLLSIIPPDYIDDNDVKFWTGTRRCPSPYVFCLEDEICLVFVYSICSIYSKIFNFKLNVKSSSNNYNNNDTEKTNSKSNKTSNKNLVDISNSNNSNKSKTNESNKLQNRSTSNSSSCKNITSSNSKTNTINYIKNFIDKIKNNKFNLNKDYISINEDYYENDDKDNTNVIILNENKEFIEAIKINLENKIKTKVNSNIINLSENSLNSIEFNLEENPEQLDFIYSTSELKAKNYNINSLSKLKTKIISSNTNLSLSTTASIITGLTTIQILNLIKNINCLTNIKHIKEAYVNAGNNEYILSQPGATKISSFESELDKLTLTDLKTKNNNEDKLAYWTIWDCIIIKQSMTLTDLIDYVSVKFDLKKHNADINTIKYKNEIIYSNTNKDSLESNVIDLCHSIYSKTLNNFKCNNKYVYIYIDCIKNNDDQFNSKIIDLPVIKYYI